ncbi:uncharacterized protein LOC143255815 [Tachypleus tridentatus]|uniref:uncharacterized protein LOC143255815 n=1 Tax=Tachypleus tridentatus TaxID=6853 RepID=UPI003FCEE8EC
MKQFVTALDKESAAFKYLRDFFLSCLRQRSNWCLRWTTNKEVPRVHRIPQEAQYEGKKSLGQICRSDSGLLDQSQSRKLCGRTGEELRQHGLQDVPESSYP